MGKNVIEKNKTMIGALGVGLLGLLFLGMDVSSGIISGLADISPFLNIAVGLVFLYVAYLVYAKKR